MSTPAIQTPPIVITNTPNTPQQAPQTAQEPPQTPQNAQNPQTENTPQNALQASPGSPPAPTTYLGLPTNRSNYDKYENVHKKVVKLLNKIQCEDAFQKVISICPESSFEVSYLPWCPRLKRFKFEALKPENSNPTLTVRQVKKDLELLEGDYYLPFVCKKNCYLCKLSASKNAQKG